MPSDGEPGPAVPPVPELTTADGATSDSATLSGRARAVRIVAGLVLGGASVAALVLQAEPGAILAALRSLTPAGFAAVCALQGGSILVCGLCWLLLTEGGTLPSCIFARFVRDGASSVFGLVPGVGEVAGARALKLGGARSGDAAASTVVDVVTESLSQVVFTLCGVAVLLGPVTGGGMLVQAGQILLAAAPPALAIFLLSRSRAALGLIERGLDWLGRLVGLGSRATGLDLVANVGRIYRRPGRVAAAGALHLGAWFLGVAQVYVAAAAMGEPLGIGPALALVSLGYAARGALFMVPMGAGVQEMTFLYAGRYVGVDDGVAVALSLVLRARDIALGVPAVLAWGLAEWRGAARAVTPPSGVAPRQAGQ